MELFVTIRDNVIANKNAVRKAFADLKDGLYKVTIVGARKRSSKQNRFYWLILSDFIQPRFYELGYREVKTPEDVHSFLTNRFLSRKILNEDTGEVIGEVTRSTTELTTVEWEEYREDINQFASEYLGIVLPDPNQQLAML